MRALKIVAGISAIAMATLLVAAPASAATLPDGQRIDVVHNFDDDGSLSSQSYQSTADAVVSNEGTLLSENVRAIDVGDDGLGYALADGVAEDNSNLAYLWHFDANTGVFSDPLPMVSSVPADVLSECFGIDLNPDGELLASCEYDDDQGLVRTYIGVVTVESDQALLTAFVTTGPTFPIVVPIEFSELATDPLSGQLWAFGAPSDTGTQGWYPVSRDGTLGTQVEVDTEAIVGADYDRSGQLWVTLGEDDGNSLIGTADPASGAVVEGPAFNSAGDPLGQVSPITVWGAVPALPATGLEALPLALGTALLLLVGAASIAAAQRGRTA